MSRAGAARVAASSARVADDGERLPAGEAHAWFPGTNQTVCGLALNRSNLQRFAGVAWADARPESGGRADFVTQVCRRCAAGLGERRDDRGWRRTAPRP
jgi:hypothetical protein